MKNAISYFKLLGSIIILLTYFNLLGQSSPDLILEGEVSSKQGIWSSDTETIYTINWFKPTRIYQGDTEFLDSIPILTPGGKTNDGLLVVSHSQFYHQYHSYILSLEVCNDCVDGLITYKPVKSVGDFNPKTFLEERQRLLSKAKTAKEKKGKDCETNENTLFISFSNASVSFEGGVLEGFIDLKMKTSFEEKVLAGIATDIKYETDVFGTNVILNQTLDILPLGANVEQAYTSTKGDVGLDRANFSMVKNPNASISILIDTSFQSVIRFSFEINSVNFASLPSELSEVLQVENFLAKFMCEGKPDFFDNIIIEDKPIGVIVKGLESDITYTFGDIEFIQPDKYQFTVFAASENVTQLRQSFLYIYYNPSTFFPNQITNGYAQIVNESGTIATDNPFYQPVWTDEGSNSISILLGGVGIPVPGDEYSTIEQDPVPLIRLEFTTSNCNSNPTIEFDQFLMQDVSYFHDEEDMPFLVMAYENVIASDMEQVYPCGCEDVEIETFSPEEIVAGDNQILTITGTGFGVFQRGLSPGEGGDGSSVLFKNGDYTLEGGSDEFIAVAEADFVSWSDTEIRVKVPSTDYAQGVHGPASTGRFAVRNGCNDEDKIGLFETLKIPYSKTNFRLNDEGEAKRLGLRNDNGLSGEQDGYVFEFSPNVASANINIKEAFDEALATWCDATNIRFTRKFQNAPFSSSTAGDGKNIIQIGSLSGVDAQAALLQSQAFFPIDCNGSDPLDEDGGFIMAELDFVVDDDFALGTDQVRAKRVFTHELGHAHMLNHARCFGFLCGGPLMHPRADTGIKDVDETGGNEIFDDSQKILLNDCEVNGSSISPIRIQSGGCGTIVATKTPVLTGLDLYPNPTNAEISISKIELLTQFVLRSSSGQPIKSGELPIGTFHLDLSIYPSGTYFLNLINDNGIGHYKIIKL